MIVGLIIAGLVAGLLLAYTGFALPVIALMVATHYKHRIVAFFKK